MTCSENSPATMRLYTTDENETTVVLMAKRHRHYRWRFLTMFANGLQSLSELDRPAVYYRALFHCLAVLDPVQFRTLTARQVADATGMAHISAQRALAMLEADRVLLRTGKGVGKKLRLNNQVAWASTSEKHNLAQMDLEIVDGRKRV